MKFATVKFSMQTALSCALLATLLGPLSTAAVAGPGQTPSFADLDLTQSAGVATAYARIKVAARKACRPTDFDIRVLGAVARVNRCMEQTIARLVDDADAPALTVYYQTTTAQPLAAVSQR